MSTFGENLKNIRIKKNLSQEELANLMGYKSGKSAISRIENGHNGVPQSTVIKFCEVLHVSPIDLLRTPAVVLSEHEEQLILKYRELSEDAKDIIDKSLGLIKKNGETTESIKKVN